MVRITKATIKEALALKEGDEDLSWHLTQEDRDKVFLHLRGKDKTFDDMEVEDAKPPLKLFT